MDKKPIGRPKSEPTTQLHIRCTERLKNALIDTVAEEREAEDSNITVSTYCIRAIKKYMVKK